MLRSSRLGLAEVTTIDIVIVEVVTLEGTIAETHVLRLLLSIAEAAVEGRNVEVSMLRLP